MNKLTEAIEHCYDVANGTCGECGKEHLQLAKWLEELKAYKSTGLEPEEIKQAYDMYLEVYSNVSEHADLMRQGLLIKLPCKVGDTVYEANISRNIVSTYKITAIVIGRDSRNYNWGLLDGVYSNMNGFNEFALGKTVFLTREKAEKALEGKENEN